MWGFLTASGGTVSVAATARAFLRANADELGLRGIRLRRQRLIRSMAAEHVIFSQELSGRMIHRAYVTVHLDPGKRVYLVKNRAVPKEIIEGIDGRFVLGRSAARAKARRTLGGKGVAVRILSLREMWLPEEDRLLPAYRLGVHRTRRGLARKKPFSSMRRRAPS